MNLILVEQQIYNRTSFGGQKFRIGDEINLTLPLSRGEGFAPTKDCKPSKSIISLAVGSYTL